MDFGNMITNIANGIHQKYDIFFSSYDLTYSQYRVLMWMFEQPEDSNINQQTLADAMGVKASSISSLVRTLERKGYLTASRNQSDQRNKCLLLTSKAEELRAALITATKNGEKQLTLGLTENQIEALKSGLSQIYQNIEESK